MTTATETKASETVVFRDAARTTHKVVQLNVKGFTQKESLIEPREGGNCLNWVLGHLVCIYEQVLPLLEQKPVLGVDAMKRYARGTPPLHDVAEAMDIAQLLNTWDEQAERIDAGLAALTPEALSKRAPASPRNDPDETVSSLLTIVSFHQAYHAGQTGILRRIVGKEGAIS